MKKAIFFDRDGILNKTIIVNSKPYSPRTLNEFKINYFLKKYINLFKKKKIFNYCYNKSTGCWFRFGF